MPPDFWDDEPAPYDEAPSQAAPPAPPPLDKAVLKTILDKEAPLFDQLKQLFPGRVVRIDPLEATPDSDEETLTGDPTTEDGAGEDIVQDSLFD